MGIRMGMFEKGDYIVYGAAGICEVKEIGKVNIGAADKNKLYYTLEPLNAKGSAVYTPIDNTKVIMRRILTVEEAEALIRAIPEIDALWVENDKQREQIYRETMRTCDCREWIRIIKTLYLRKQDRIARGKKVTTTDERYLRMAEENLYTELSIPLGIEKEKMADYITEKVTNMSQESTIV